MAKILFIQQEKFFFKENIGVMQCSSVLKQNGHQVDVALIGGDGRLTKTEKPSVLSAFVALAKEYYAAIRTQKERSEQNSARREIIDYVREYKPDIIGFSVLTINSVWTLKIADLLKRNGVRALIVAGGPHPTFFKDYINNDCIDAINIGEGEYSLLELANAVERNRDITSIENLHVKKDGRVYRNPVRPLANINELPFPDRDLYMKYEVFRKQKTYNFIATRGCFYNCTFCFIHQWNVEYKEDPNKVRLRDIDGIISEIKEFAQKTRVEKLYFSDSTLNLDKKWTVDFLTRYGKEVGLPYSLNLRPNLLDDDIAKAIAASGCETVRIGIETGNEKNRRRILGKYISDKKIYEAVDLLKKYRIKFVANVMFGLPGETLEEAMETVEMLQKIEPYLPSPQLFHPYPGLNITRKAVKDGYVTEDELKEIGNNEYEISKSVLKQRDIDSVVNLMKLSIIAVKFPVLWPLIKKLAHLKPNKIFSSAHVISSFILYWSRVH